MNPQEENGTLASERQAINTTGAETTSCSNEVPVVTEISESNSAIFSYISSSLKWCPTSEYELAQIEGELLASKYSQRDIVA